MAAVNFRFGIIDKPIGATQWQAILWMPGYERNTGLLAIDESFRFENVPDKTYLYVITYSYYPNVITDGDFWEGMREYWWENDKCYGADCIARVVREVSEDELDPPADPNENVTFSVRLKQDNLPPEVAKWGVVWYNTANNTSVSSGIVDKSQTVEFVDVVRRAWLYVSGYDAAHNRIIDGGGWGEYTMANNVIYEADIVNHLIYKYVLSNGNGNGFKLTWGIVIPVAILIMIIGGLAGRRR